jgi:hypothetical protein
MGFTVAKPAREGQANNRKSRYFFSRLPISRNRQTRQLPAFQLTCRAGAGTNSLTLDLTVNTKYKRLNLYGRNGTDTLTVLGGQLNLPAEQQSEASVLVEIAPDKLASGTTPIQVGVFAAGKRIDKIKTIFIGPRK